ncbi:hypothetical protein ES707_18274 [subsurface metagenome]
METKVSSVNKEVIIGHDRPTVLIGERINPTGKKKLVAALQAGDLELVCQEALAQLPLVTDSRTYRTQMITGISTLSHCLRFMLVHHCLRALEQ